MKDMYADSAGAGYVPFDAGGNMTFLKGKTISDHPAACSRGLPNDTPPMALRRTISAAG